MPRFEKTPTPRERLAEAINDRDAARQAVVDARYAEDKAREHTYAAEHEADELRKRAEAPESGDDAVAAITRGDVLELARPAAEARAAIEAAEQRIAAWRHAADLAESAVPIRQDALERGEKRVEECARAVVVESIDIDKMLAETKEAADWLVGQRALLLHLMSILPRESPDRAAVSDYLASPWLAGEYDDKWRKNPSIKPYAQAFEQLLRDPETPLP
jgi:hypothetical protein